MKDRMQLTDAELDLVFGGAWNYYDDGDQKMCHVDNYGTWKCTQDAASKIRKLKAQNMDKTVQDIINMAISLGYFW